MSFHRVWSWAGCYLLRLRTVSQNRPGHFLAYVLPLSTYLPCTASQLPSALPERTFCFPTSTSLIFDTFPWAVSSAQQIPLYPSNPLSNDSSLMKWPHVPVCNDCSSFPEPPFSFRRTVLSFRRTQTWRWLFLVLVPALSYHWSFWKLPLPLLTQGITLGLQ